MCARAHIHTRTHQVPRSATTMGTRMVFSSWMAVSLTTNTVSRELRGHNEGAVVCVLGMREQRVCVSVSVMRERCGVC